MFSQPAAIAAILAASCAMFAAVDLSRRIWHPRPETARKLLHVAMGVLALTYPWLFNSAWPVVLLCASYVALLGLAVAIGGLRHRLYQTIYAIDRPSLGEFYFPLAVAVLFILARGSILLYCLPIAILTLADAAAAMVGTRYGRTPYLLRGGRKTVEGSAAFFIAAFWIVHVPLLLTCPIPPAAALSIAFTVAVMTTALEAICHRGIDNLLVPLASFAAIKLLVAL